MERTPAEIRDMLAEFMCPICESGPWPSVGTHASKQHGVKAHGLKNMAELPYSHSLVAPELKARLAARPRHHLPLTGEAEQRRLEALRRSMRNLSTYGRRVRSANGKKLAPVGRVAAASERAQRRRAEGLKDLENLKLILEEKGWSGRDLAGATGIHFTSVYDIMHGRQSPKPETRQKIAAALGRSERFLFGPSSHRPSH